MKARIEKLASRPALNKLVIAASVSILVLVSGNEVQAQEHLPSPVFACEDLQQALAGEMRVKSSQLQLASAGNGTNTTDAPSGCRWFMADQVVVIIRRRQEQDAACVAVPGYRNAMDEAFEDPNEPECFWTSEKALSGRR